MLHLTRDQGRGIANYRAIMVTRIERERAMLDVYRIDLPTGAHSVVCENQGFAGSIPGPGGAIRFAARVSSGGDVPDPPQCVVMLASVPCERRRRSRPSAQSPGRVLNRRAAIE